MKKLTEKAVIEARTIYNQAQALREKLDEKCSAKGLAKKYGVNVRTMERLLSGETWKHI